MIVEYQAIADYFTLANDFNTAVGGRFRYGEAKPEWKTEDHAVYFGIPSPESGYGIREFSFQINCYSTRSGRAETIMNEADKRFNRAVLVLPGYKKLRLKAVLWVPAFKDGDKWCASIEFEGYLIKFI